MGHCTWAFASDKDRIHSHLQACGIINDHAGDCPCFARINAIYPTIKMKPDHEVGHA